MQLYVYVCVYIYIYLSNTWRTAEGGVADGGIRFSLYGIPNCGLRFCAKIAQAVRNTQLTFGSHARPDCALHLVIS